jgi:hypothetical protein
MKEKDTEKPLVVIVYTLTPKRDEKALQQISELVTTK